MSTILAIDCATGPCSVAIWHKNAVAAYVEQPKPVMQSATLMPMIEQALKQSRLGYRDLTAVAATIGPGSFTGIRVGLAAARGICFAAKIPGLGFTTLETLAFAARDKGKVLTILNAGKGEVYYQLFAPKPTTEPQLGTLEAALAAAPNTFTTGNIGCENPGFPHADALAELAASGAASQALIPFYIRPPDAKLPKAAG